MSPFHRAESARSCFPRSALVVPVLAAVILLAGCQGDPAPDPDPTPSEEQTAPEGEECSGLTGEEAAERWAGDVPPPQVDPAMTWDVGAAVTDGYDECAALSWIVLPVEGATVSSPFQVMLFHSGEYLGTTTEDAYGFEPAVERADDAEIAVTYPWLREGDPNAEPSGSSTAVFTWDEERGSVVMSGEVPPEQPGASEPAAIPSSCDAVLTDELRAELAEYPLTETVETEHLECHWAPEGADTTSLSTVITRVNDDEAQGTIDELRDQEGFDCSESAAGTRCEKTWDNEMYPVVDGRTVFLGRSVLIDTTYSNLAPEGYTDSIVATIFGG